MPRGTYDRAVLNPDLHGQQFGRWQVLGRAPNRHQRSRWLCKCECGMEREVESFRLTGGISTHCGCSRVKFATRLTAERLRELLRYEPETGEFVRVKAVLQWRAGAKAGQLRKTGYVAITIDCVRYPAHRLAWLYMTGGWPEHELDHRDGDKANNRWANLREVDRKTNTQNVTKARVNNRLGVLGVTQTPNGTYRAQIRREGRIVGLGTYPTAERAGEVYLSALRELDPHGAVAIESGSTT